MATGWVDKNPTRPKSCYVKNDTHTCTDEFRCWFWVPTGFDKKKKFNQISFRLTGPMDTHRCKLAPAPVLTSGQVQMHPWVNL
jgi:hypothetical protein